MELFVALLKFFLLFGLVLVLAWLTTRLTSWQLSAGGRNRPVRVLQQVPAGRDRSVVLLELGGKIYLLGATGQQISLIDAIDEPETVRRILEEVPTAVQKPLGSLLPSSFAGVLDKVMAGAAKPPAAAPQQPSSRETDHLAEQIERLRRLQEKNK